MQRLHTFRSSARPFATKAPGVHACTSIARLARQQHKQRLSSPPASLAGTAGGAGDAASNEKPAEAPVKQEGFWTKVKDWVTGAKDREKLASMGMAAFFSYGVVSNVTYSICLGIAWLTFVKQKGVSPLVEGQWVPFLAFYAGLWTLQNFVRPLRFAFAMAITPVFDRLLCFVAEKTGTKKPVAFSICLGVMAVTMTISLFGGLYLLGGIPEGLGPLPPLKRF